MKNLLRVLLGPILVLASCKEVTDEPPSVAGVAGSVEDQLGDSIASAGTAHQAGLDLAAFASNDFAVDLNQEVRADLDAAEFDRMLQVFFLAQMKWSGDAFRLGLARKSMTSKSGLHESVGTEKSGLLVIAGLAVAGAALMGISAMQGVEKTADARARPVRNRLTMATPEERQLAAQSMGLPSTPASNGDLVEAFDNLRATDRTTAAKNVEDAFSEAADNGQQGVTRIDENQLRDAFAETAREAGATAVKTVVSGNTAATGGQGYAQVASLRAGEVASGVWDLTVSAVSTLTGQPLQPLDILAAHLETSAVSQDGTVVVIDARPSRNLSIEDALAILDDPDASTQDINDALARLAEDIAEDEAVNATFNEDGSVEIEVPDQLALGSYDEPKNETDIKLPASLGDLFDVLMVAKGQQLQTYEGVSDGSTVEYLVDGEGGVDPMPPGCNTSPCDADGDGAADSVDNCPDVANPDQIDSDGDGIGNECDTDPCPQYAEIACEGSTNACIEGFCWSRNVVGCIQETCPTGAGRTYTEDCCCDCWADKSLRNVFDPCRPGFLLFCAERGQ